MSRRSKRSSCAHIRPNARRTHDPPPPDMHLNRTHEEGLSSIGRNGAFNRPQRMRSLKRSHSFAFDIPTTSSYRHRHRFACCRAILAYGYASPTMNFGTRKREEFRIREVRREDSVARCDSEQWTKRTHTRALYGAAVDIFRFQWADMVIE